MKKQFTLLFTALGFMSMTAQTFQWADSFSGTGTERSNGVVVDASGNVYTAGTLFGTADFDPGPGTFTLTAGNGGAFISKVDANGNFVWAKAITASGGCYINAIALDPSGNVLTTGGFQNTIDLDPGAGVDYQTAFNNNDVFVSKLDANGNYVWGKIFGGGGVEWGDAIAVDASGDVYITGNFTSTNMDFDPSATTNSVSTTGSADIFINKLSSTGNYVWGKKLGGTAADYGKGVKVDASMNVYLTGYFTTNADFDPSASTYTLAGGGQDAFVSKLDASGNFVWAKNLGGTATESAYAITLDPSGNVLTTGYCTGGGDYDPGPGVFTLSSGGVFISKLDNAGNFVWAAKLAGFGCYGYAITTDALGNVFTTGMYSLNGDFDPGPGTVTLNSVSGSSDVFVSQLDAAGNYIWAGTMGDASTESGFGIAVRNNDVHITGYYNGTSDFDPTAGTFTMTPAGGYDAFVMKFSAAAMGIKEAPHGTETAVAFPNPNNGTFNILSSVPFTAIKVYNQLGALVLEKESEGLNTSIEMNDAAKGIYFYQIMNKNEVMKTGKVVVE